MKTFTLFVLLLLSSICNSQIYTIAAVEFGYEDRAFRYFNETTQRSTDVHWLKNKTVVTMSLDVLYKGFTVYTDIKSYVAPNHLFSYRPYQVQYLSGIQYEFAKIPLSLRVSHMCSHSVDSKMFREAFTSVTARITILNTLHNQNSN